MKKKEIKDKKIMEKISRWRFKAASARHVGQIDYLADRMCSYYCKKYNDLYKKVEKEIYRSYEK